MNQTKEIELLLRAKHDLLYISTFEELRLMDNIIGLSRGLGMDTIVWSFASGLKHYPADTATKIELPKESFAGDPVMIFNYVKTLSKDTVVVLKDYHSF